MSKQQLTIYETQLLQQQELLINTLRSLVLSMAAHPDCTKGSEFDDLSTIGQELINKIKDNDFRYKG